MSSRQNLNDGINEAFEFTLGGKDYDLLYPTMQQIDPITDLNQALQVERAKETPESVEKVIELEKALEKEFYKLIVPVGHDTPVQDTLKTQPFPVIKAFNKMVAEQLSAE